MMYGNNGNKQDDNKAAQNKSFLSKNLRIVVKQLITKNLSSLKKKKLHICLRNICSRSRQAEALLKVNQSQND